MMEMIKAMQVCEPDGFVSRRAYPSIRYYKNRAGIFQDAHLVSRIDFLSADWDVHPPVDEFDERVRAAEEFMQSLRYL